MSVVVGVGGVPFQDDLVLSVAVDICHAGIIGGIAVFPSVWRLAIIGLLQRDAQITVGGVAIQNVSAVDAAPPYFVCGRRQWFVVDEEGAALGERLAVEFLAIAVDIEGLSDSIGGEGAPTDDDLLTISDGHNPTVQVFTLDLLHVVVRLRYSRQHA